MIQLNQVSKQFQTGKQKFSALKSVNLNVEQGKFVAVLGKSGSGKSTLLHIIAGIDSASSGEVTVHGTGVHKLNQEQLAAWRGKNVGIVFQFFQLLPTLTIKENILLAMDFCKIIPNRNRNQRAEELLNQFGISAYANQLPIHLSGGQQQRAAIARALANDPPLILADEPTGNLDTQTAGEVLGLFSSLVSAGKTVLMVTHERDISTMVDRAITLNDGEIVGEVSYANTVA